MNKQVSEVMIFNLNKAEALELSRISVYQRCKNIEYATRILISRLHEKG